MNRKKFVDSVFTRWTEVELWDIRPMEAADLASVAGIQRPIFYKSSELKKLKKNGFSSVSGKNLMERIVQLEKLLPKDPLHPLVLLDSGPKIMAQAIWQHFQPFHPTYIYKPGVQGLLNEANELLKTDFNFVQLFGKTGSGKTELLNILKGEGAQTLDLARLARHTGSGFGNLENKTQPSQESFVLSIAVNLLQLNKKSRIFVEFENGHLGQNLLPLSLQENFTNSKKVWLEVSEESRISRLVDQYAQVNDRKISEVIDSLRSRLGLEETERLKSHLFRKNYSEVARGLIAYFDQGDSYQKKEESWYDLILQNENPTHSAKQLLIKYP